MSIELFFPGPRSPRWLRVGPLARDLDGFAADLAAQGYSSQTAVIKLRLVRHLSLWLENEGLGAEALDEGVSRRFYSPADLGEWRKANRRRVGNC